jgi:hypothetical protein
MTRDRIAALMAVCLLSQGCGAGWHRVGLVGPYATGQQAQVWHGGRAEQWHAVVVRADSVTGVPYFNPVSCDSCRVAIPRAEVDSVRFGDPVAGFLKSVGLVLAAMYAWLWVYYR